VESGAVAIGPEMAIRALGAGRGPTFSGNYRNGISNVEPEVRVFLERMVLPRRSTRIAR